ncbi:MAG: HNH endonuclease [Candidatus Nanohaloarchaea archaeon]|nr:HNH endonuclease [Candidatus Nanohaloarchaea archaeon]
MPPAAVTTYEDLICYEYAKLIAAAADMKGNYGFIMSRMKKLEQGEIEMSDVVKEDRYVAEEGAEQCIYCGTELDGDIHWDHLVPRNSGGDDVFSNQVPACKHCNSSKGDRDVISWYQERDTAIPRIVWGKYLKFKYDEWKKEGKLDKELPEDEREKWSGLDVDR